MDLISYVARRLAIIIPTLLGASVVIFVLTMLIPGDPALMRLGNFATAEQLQSLREEMGLTKPPYERYMLYLGGLLRGDMGRSWRTGNLVLDDLRARLPMSLELGLYSMLLAIAIGIPIGVWGAASKDSVVDYGSKVYGILGVAMPLFWGGLVLVYVFYFKLGIAPPPTGRIDMLVSPPKPITGSYPEASPQLSNYAQNAGKQDMILEQFSEFFGQGAQAIFPHLGNEFKEHQTLAEEGQLSRSRCPQHPVHARILSALPSKVSNVWASTASRNSASRR